MNLPWIFLTAICTAFWLGFVLHTSSGSELFLGKYTDGYTLFLLLLTVLLCGVLWVAWRWRDRLANTLGSIAVLAGITTVLMLLVLPPAYIYLHNRSLDKNLLAPLDPQAHAFFQYDIAPDIPLDPDNKSIRILALGGSTTYGPRLERDEAYPAVLEARLQERFPAASISLLNAGVPWYTSKHSLLRYIDRYADWKPHIIIVLHAFNDIFQTSEGHLTNGKFRNDYGHFFGALGKRVNPKDSFRDNLAHFFDKNWFVRTWYSDLHKQEPADADKPEVDLLRTLPSFRHNMAALVQRASQDGTQVILANQPYLYQEKMPENEQDMLFYDFYYKDYAIVPGINKQMLAMQTFNAASEELAGLADTWFVDLESGLPKTTDFLYDDVHYTAAGASRVADLFFEHLPWEEIITNANSRQ